MSEMNLAIDFTYKKRVGVKTPDCKLTVDCESNHTLLDLIKVFVGTFELEHLWFEFFDSHDEILYGKMETVEDYLKTNTPIIYCTPKVPLKFHELPGTFKTWCLGHGIKFDYGPMPEIHRNTGFDHKLELLTACEQFSANKSLEDQEMDFFDSNGYSLFERFAEHMPVQTFFEENGPMIFFKYRPKPNEKRFTFYMNTTHDPHACVKQFTWGEHMTVDELSPNYQYERTSLMQVSHGDILRFVKPNVKVLNVLHNAANYRLDKLNYEEKTRQHYDVSVRFINGGDLFINPILIWAKHGETINKFSQKLVKKMFDKESMNDFIDQTPLKDVLNMLIINIGDEKERKCSSAVRIPQLSIPEPFPVFIVNAKNLQDKLKHCDYEYAFYFYDRTQPQDRVCFKYTKIISFIPHKMSSVVDKFIVKKQLNPEQVEFFNSRGQPIDQEATVNKFAQKNDLVILYESNT